MPRMWRTGNISIDRLSTYALFDCVASHSFISKSFSKHLERMPEILKLPYRVATLEGEVMTTNLISRDCNLDLGKGKELKVDLIRLKMRDFDIILGIDWLAKSFARVECRNKVVNFCLPLDHTFTFYGNLMDQPS